MESRGRIEGCFQVAMQPPSGHAIWEGMRLRLGDEYLVELRPPVTCPAEGADTKGFRTYAEARPFYSATSIEAGSLGGQISSSTSWSKM